MCAAPLPHQLLLPVELHWAAAQRERGDHPGLINLFYNLASYEQIVGLKLRSRIAA